MAVRVPWSRLSSRLGSAAAAAAEPVTAEAATAEAAAEPVTAEAATAEAASVTAASGAAQTL